jgi:hypothetical protein
MSQGMLAGAMLVRFCAVASIQVSMTKAQHSY